MVSLKRVNDINGLKQFYIKRVMRIYPVFLFVSFVVIFLLSLIEYLELETLTMFRDTILAQSNFRAEKINLDYFGSNNNNYLLHLWTISIELQFYLFFPLLMLFTKTRKNILFLTMSLVISSLIILAFERSYYDSLGRMFAFCSGSVTYLLSNKVKENNFLFILSLMALVSLSFFDLNVKDYPNYNGVSVVILTSLALLFGKVDSKLRYKPLIFIGLISYSLYLWHYPLFLFFNHSSIENNFFNVSILLFVLVVLSMFSYFMIEKRFIQKNYGNYTALVIVIPFLFLVLLSYQKKNQTFDIPSVQFIYEKITLNPLLYYSDLKNLNVSKTYAGCLDNKGELLTHCSSTKVNAETKTALVMGNSFVHSGGLIFIDKITAHYNIKSDFYYMFRDKKKTDELYENIRLGKYDYLIVYYPWLNANRESLVKQYKELSQYAQIVFLKGTKYNLDVNKKQLFRFNNIFKKDGENYFRCITKKPYSTDFGYQEVDAVLEELNAKRINMYELQRDAHGDYLCSYEKTALYTDNFHINNYAGNLFAQWFIARDQGKDVFRH